MVLSLNTLSDKACIDRRSSTTREDHFSQMGHPCGLCLLCVPSRFVAICECKLISCGVVFQSVEDIVEVVLVEELHVLFASSSEAVKQIIDIGLAELCRVLKLRPVVLDVVVLLNGFNNVALALELEELLGHHDVRVADWHQEGTEITLDLVKSGRVAEGTLVVGDRPLGSSHDAQVVVPVQVQRCRQSVLGESTLLSYTIQVHTRLGDTDMRFESA